jgi:hypothetical protein
MSDEIKVSIQFPNEITVNTACVTRIAERLYRLEQDPLILVFAEDEDEAVLLPGFRDIIEAEEIGPTTLKFVRIIERAKFKRFEFLISEEFATSPKMTAVADKIIGHNGHCETIMGGILIIYLPEEVEYDPSDDL